MSTPITSCIMLNRYPCERYQYSTLTFFNLKKLGDVSKVGSFTGQTDRLSIFRHPRASAAPE